MAIERRIIVGVDDVKAVTFQCSSCGARTPVPINSLSEVPQQCNSCQAIWWRSNDFATHVTTSGPAATAFIQAIRTFAAISATRKIPSASC